MKEATFLSIRFYSLVARLFPEEFRALHSRPLLESSEDLIHDVAARHGMLGLIPMMFRILIDLIVRVVSEHFRDLWQDTRHSLRVLKASPGFMIAATLSIALGIGVAIGVFSQMDSMILAPLEGVRNPDSLVTTSGVSFPVYEAFADDGPFIGLAAYATVPVAWNDENRIPPTHLGPSRLNQLLHVPWNPSTPGTSVHRWRRSANRRTERTALAIGSRRRPSNHRA